MNVTFSVPGRARPQGSKRPIPTKGGIRLVEQVKGLPDWRAQVRHEGWTACENGPVDVPVSMHVTFVFARPKGHFGASGQLKPTADRFPSKRSVGDVDKLLRAVFDALTGVCFADDSLVVSVIARKVYGFPERCEISATTEIVSLPGEAA